MENLESLGLFANAIWWILFLSALPFVVMTLMGGAVSIVGAIIQLQDQSITFGVKMMALIIILFLFGPRAFEEFCAWVREIIVTT